MNGFFGFNINYAAAVGAAFALGGRTAGGVALGLVAAIGFWQSRSR